MWELAGTWDFAVDGLAASPIVFDGLEGAEEIMVIIDGLTRSVSGITRVQLGVDSTSGLTFFETSGDYLKCTGAGVASDDTGINLHTTDATAARSGNMHLQATAVGSTTAFAGVPKFTTAIDGNSYVFVGSLEPVTALRLVASNGGDFDGGKAYVLIRTVGDESAGVDLNKRRNWVICT